MAAVRMIWVPKVCCVQPTAYMMVATFFMSQSLRMEVNRSAAFTNWSLGMPVMRSTISGV